ncbi:MAG: metallophosphoesterase family protein [Candidatus Kariarchaeaceae archaeon]|jgi:3',5'-cyclic AMP phosphodiesterase CpdA
MKFIVISDTHIGGRFTEVPLLRGIELINEMEDIDFLIHAGDLTEAGTLTNYTLAIKYLEKLKKDLLIVPGNHDAGNVGYLLFEELIGPRYFVNEDKAKKVKILGIDSSIPDLAAGRIGYSGIRSIYREFSDLGSDWLKVLVFHHHAVPIPHTGRERSAIYDAGDVIKAILDCDINLVLNGHRHISNVFRLNNGNEFQSLIVNSGTLCSKKTRYREQYSLTEISFSDNLNEALVKIIDLTEKEIGEAVRYAGPVMKDATFERGKIIGKIIQISKTQFSSSSMNHEMYDRGVRIINQMDCDVLVHCGDVTDESLVEEFEMAALKLTQIVDRPKIIVPGPHDTRSLGWELYEEFISESELFFGGLDWVTWSNSQLDIAGINSCLLEESTGRIGRNKSESIIDLLKVSEKFPIVAFHHTLIPLPRTKHEAELTDAGDILSTITKANIPLVLTGSKYKSGCWQVDNTVVVNVGPFSSKKITTRRGNSFINIIIYESTDETHYILEVFEILISNNHSEKLGLFFVPKISLD